MDKVEIYSSPNCKYCDMAKDFLDNLGEHYEVIDIVETPSGREFLVSQGLRSVPQIWINDHHVGGYDLLLNYYMNQQDKELQA